MVIPNVWLTERLNCGAWIDLPLVNLCVQRCYHETLQSHVFATMKSKLSYLRSGRLPVILVILFAFCLLVILNYPVLTVMGDLKE